MRSVFKKICLAMTGIFMPIIGNAQDYDDQGYGCDQGYSNQGYICEQPCYQAPCCPPSCNKWIVSADLLYWRASEQGLICECDSADIVDSIDANGRTVSSLTTDDDDFHDKWDLGYRVGLGYENGANCWDAAVLWTHYHQNSKRKHGCENHARWKLDVNVVDVIGGRSFSMGSCFSVNPYAGLRGAWIQQKVHGHFVNSEDTIGGEILTTADENRKQDFWGVGPEIGVEADWGLGRCFSLYGGAAAALLYGRYEVKFDSEEVLSAVTFIDHGKHRHFCACQSVIDAALGVRWHKSFCNNWAVSLSLGWEHHRYFDFNQFGSSDDLCLDGLVFSGAIQF